MFSTLLAASYFRVFEWGGAIYGIAMPGILYRSEDRFRGFRRGPQVFSDEMRHCAVLVRGSTLHVFYSEVGDRPERINPPLWTWVGIGLTGVPRTHEPLSLRRRTR